MPWRACLSDSFKNGSGVIVDSAGKLDGVSVNSAAGKILEQLTEGIPHNKVGITTVGDIRAAGGDVISSPTRNNPNHATLSGITADKAQDLMAPTQKNPSAKPKPKGEGGLMQYNYISDEELFLIKERCEKTTKGPWVSYIEGRDHSSGSNFIMTGDENNRGEDIELIGAINNRRSGIYSSCKARYTSIN